MADRPTFLKSGERARLFPVLAETSKEGRTLSVVLSCLANVHEFGESLFKSVGQRVGARTNIEVFTEIVFAETEKNKLRPDGLVVLKAGSRIWTALIEAKVGLQKLDAQQIERYLQLAKEKKIDAVITISNQFTVRPDHHPISISKVAQRKVELYHWSWMSILTQATLLLSANEVKDREQVVILSELVRFLSHSSTGVQGFDRMPSVWRDFVVGVRGRAPITKGSDETQKIVAAWHEEVRDLSLVLSRLLAASVTVRLPRTHKADAKKRLMDDCNELVETKKLRCELEVPDAANPVVVEADLLTRSVLISMRLPAPGDKKSSLARTNWLLRQLKKTNSKEVYVRAIWPGAATATQVLLYILNESPEDLSRDRPKMALTSFEIILVRDLGGKFSGVRTFVEELERAVSDFYEEVGQYLRSWQPSAPRMKDKKEPEQVTPAAIQNEYEVSPPISEESNQGGEVDNPPV